MATQSTLHHHTTTHTTPQREAIPSSNSSTLSSSPTSISSPSQATPHAQILISRVTTRAQHGIFKPNPKYNLHTQVSISPLPLNPVFALNDHNWKLAMTDEYNALIKNKTWDLVPRPPNVNVIMSMWIFRHKEKSDGSFERHKARLVEDEKTQQIGISCRETFSPVVKPATIRTVLCLALSKKWSIPQLDVKNAFLHGKLQETFYMHLGFRDPAKLNHVCLLKKSLYGLKHAPRAWYQRFADYVSPIGFSYTSSDTLRQSIMTLLSSEFAMKELGSLHYFLGIAVHHHAGGLLLSQKKYAMKIIEKADIQYAVQQICLFMHNPMTDHMNALKRIIRYIQGTLDYGLHLYHSSSSSLISYTDADWAGCPDTRLSTSGYCMFLGNNLISWSSKRQATISRSSAEAEYRGVANVVSESCWLRNLLLELHHPLDKATLVHCDNLSDVYLSCNPVQHQRTKHVEIDIHFLREKVSRGEVRVLHVPSQHQIADIFTKCLPRILFDDFRTSLSVRPPPASTAGV
ncbi:transmembrane signal receptor [Lithospermum erythrorhizon]|uniref:Transmembrane signal receptor n=1 Tax=Lithospermum erythrorhizon TaxID=34254 RepID=A0AAV3PNF0_LITER